MEYDGIKRGVKLAAVFMAFWLGVRYLSGIVLPFLLGWGVASLAEPVVGRLSGRLRLPRALASAVGVTLALGILVGGLCLLAALGYRELGRIAGTLPDTAAAVTRAVERLHRWALELAMRAPQGLSGPLRRAVTALFEQGGTLLANLASGILGGVGRLVSGLSGWLLTLGVALLSAYMISAQLPQLKAGACRLSWWKRVRQVGSGVRCALGGWLRAQLRLMSVTFVIVSGGLLLLRVKGWLLWAAVTALVDAVPLLGTGTVLIPWAAVCLLQGQVARAVGIGGIYLTAALTRSALEPRFMGKQLGMNPLATLAVLYTGFRLWGVGGMILAPVVALLAVRLCGAGHLRPGEDVV